MNFLSFFFFFFFNFTSRYCYFYFKEYSCLNIISDVPTLFPVVYSNIRCNVVVTLYKSLLNTSKIKTHLGTKTNLPNETAGYIGDRLAEGAGTFEWRS